MLRPVTEKHSRWSRLRRPTGQSAGWRLAVQVVAPTVVVCAGAAFFLVRLGSACEVPGGSPKLGPTLGALYMVSADAGWGVAGEVLLHTSDGARQFSAATPKGFRFQTGATAASFIDAAHAWVADLASDGRSTQVFR